MVDFADYMATRPVDIVPDTAIAVKVVAVAGYDHDWTAYYGPTSWSDSQVAESGDKLPQYAGEALFPQFRRARLYYWD